MDKNITLADIADTFTELGDLIRAEIPKPTVAVDEPTMNAYERWVIVRGDRSGVFFGWLVSEEGQTVELAKCRHLWYWSGAANTAELALSGVSRPENCKFVAPVPRLRVLDAIEIIDCTGNAVESLSAVPVWSQR